MRGPDKPQRQLPRLERRSYAPARARHKHDYHQIVLPRLGAMEIDIDGRGGVVDAGQAAFVPDGAMHEFASSEASDFIVLDIDTRHFARLPEGFRVLDTFAQARFFPMTSGLRYLVGYAASCAGRCDTPAVAEAWIALFVDDALHRVAPGAGPRSAPLNRACIFIEDRLAEPLTVARIARMAGVSPRGLHDLFRRELSTTPHGYLTERRLARVMDLLDRTGKPIDEIAYLTGYTDQSALTRALRKARGITPAAYRRARAARRGGGG